VPKGVTQEGNPKYGDDAAFFVASFAFHLCQVRVAEAESVTTSYTGALATSQSVFETTLNVTSPADVLLQTFGFGGGTNAQGTVIGPGGTFVARLLPAGVTCH
jgi:hypothetical protein